jgi:hypothetical protein
MSNAMERVQLKVEGKDEAQALVSLSPWGERETMGPSAVKEKPRETSIAQ